MDLLKEIPLRISFFEQQTGMNRFLAPVADRHKGQSPPATPSKAGGVPPFSGTTGRRRPSAFFFPTQLWAP